MNKTKSQLPSDRAWRIPFQLLVLLALAYFPLFLHLDVLPLRIYDESRLAVNALEMTDNGNLLVTHFDGRPDMWNLKPPLMIWLQALCMKVFGYNALAVRLPAALFGLASVLMLFGFGARFLGSTLLGFLSALTLLTTPGFIDIHVTRSGDYDAMLCFFMLAYAFSFFKYLEKGPGKTPRDLYYTGLFISLAVLTKGIAGLMFLPALFLYTLWKKQLWSLLRSPHFYAVIILAMLPVASYYLGREYFNPGYLQAVWDNEIGGRYNEVIEGHQAPFNFYFNKLRHADFAPWLWWLPLSIVLGLFSKKNHLRDITIFSLLVSGTFVLIISAAQTKLNWYAAPVLPFLALMTGIGIYLVIRAILPLFDPFNPSLKLASCGLLLLAYFGKPYTQIIAKVYHPVDYEVDRQKMLFGPFMERIKDVDTYYIASSGYNSHINFHKKAEGKKGKAINVIYPKGVDLPPGSKVMLCEDLMMKKFHKHYTNKIIARYKDCQLVEVTAR